MIIIVFITLFYDDIVSSTVEEWSNYDWWWCCYLLPGTINEKIRLRQSGNSPFTLIIALLFTLFLFSPSSLFLHSTCSIINSTNQMQDRSLHDSHVMIVRTLDYNTVNVNINSSIWILSYHGWEWHFMKKRMNFVSRYIIIISIIIIIHHHCHHAY